MPMGGSAHAGHAAHHAAPATDGFLCSAPFLISCGALLAAIVALRVLQGRRGGPDVHVSGWPFAVLVPLGFLLHHHLRHLVDGSVGPLLEPALLVGLVLQLPFALVVYLVVTALLRVADRIGAALAAPARRRTDPPAVARPPAAHARIRLALLATAAAPRAPPASA